MPERLDPEIVQFFVGKGYPATQARGIAAGIQAESGSDHTVRGGYKGRAVGLGQWLGDRREALLSKFGPNPSKTQQLEFLHDELQGGDQGGQAVLSQRSEAGVLHAYITKFMRPAKGSQTVGDIRRGREALGLSPKDRNAAVSAGRRSGGSTFDRVTAAEAKASSLDDVFRARMNVGKPGGMTAQDAAVFDTARAHGQIVGAPSWFKAPAPPRDVPELPADVLAAYNSHRMDDDPEARKAVEESVASGQVRLPKGQRLQAPPARTVGERLGMGTRAVMTGLGSVADVIAAPLNTTVNAVAGTNLSTSPGRDLATSTADSMGLAKPETPTENLYAGMQEGGAMGLGTAGLGMAAAPVQGATGTIARTLASSPLLDTASGASAGGSQELARQAGAGPVGQVAAGLIGGLTPVGVRGVVERIRAPKTLPEAVASTPREAVMTPDGELTPHGQDIAARHGATPEQVKQAYEAPPSVQRGVANDGADPSLAKAANDSAPADMPVQDAPPPVETPAPIRAAPDAAPADAPSPVARVEAGKEIGVDYSRGQATRNFDIQDAEQRLRNSNGPEGDQMRAFVAKQNDQVKAAVDDFRAAIDDTQSTPEERGTQVQEAMRELRDLGQQGVSALYKQARELGAPVELDTAPIKRTFEGLMAEAEIPEPVKKVLEAEAARYGLIGKVETTAEGALTNEAGVTTVKLDDGSKIRFRGEPKALALDTAEDFRKVVSAQYLSDGPRKLTQELKTALDDAVEEAVARTAKGGDPSIAGAMKQARAAHVEQVKTFRAKDVVQDIIDWKKGTATAKLSPEQVVQRAFAKTSDLKRIKAVLLSKPTVASKQAWTTLQGHGVASIFDKATVRNSNINGEITEAISGAKLRTAVENFGTDKLKVLLDPAQFNQMMKLQRVIEDVTIPISGTVNPSGSGNLLMRLSASIVGRIPIAGGFYGRVSEGLGALINHAKQIAENAETTRGLNYDVAAAKVDTAKPGQAPAKASVAKVAADKAGAFVKDFIDTFKTPDVLAPVLVATQQEQD